MPTTTISNLTCEYQINPLGIDVLQPRLSWQMHSDQRGAHQTAYQIFVASSEASLTSGQGLLWDSGKVKTDQSTQVVYRGPALAAGQRVYWKIWARPICVTSSADTATLTSPTNYLIRKTIPRGYTR